MARISAENVTKREDFLRGFITKMKEQNKKVTLESANEALVKKFGKGTPKMRGERVYGLRDEIFGLTKSDQRNVKAAKKGAEANHPDLRTKAGREWKATHSTFASASAGPTTAKRGPGRPRKVQPETNGHSGLFVLSGDVKRLLALADAAGVACTLDEAATQAVTVLRASA
jgi:hypothetical protein